MSGTVHDKSSQFYDFFHLTSSFPQGYARTLDASSVFIANAIKESRWIWRKTEDILALILKDTEDGIPLSSIIECNEHIFSKYKNA